MTKKIRVIHEKIGEVPFLFLCLAVWVAIFSLILTVSGYTGYLPGFLLGSAGSAWYAYMLYRRVPVMLSRPSGAKPFRPEPDMVRPARPFSLKQLWSGWVKTLQPVAAIALIILMVTQFFPKVSFLAALFGFFSFQISLFLYAILVSFE